MLSRSISFCGWWNDWRWLSIVFHCCSTCQWILSFCVSTEGVFVTFFRLAIYIFSISQVPSASFKFDTNNKTKRTNVVKSSSERTADDESLWRYYYSYWTSYEWKWATLGCWTAERKTGKEKLGFQMAECYAGLLSGAGVRCCWTWSATWIKVPKSKGVDVFVFNYIHLIDCVALWILMERAR